MKERLNKKTFWTLTSFGIIVFGGYVVYSDGFVQMQDARKNNPEVTEPTLNGQPILSSHFPPFDNRNYDFPQRVDKNGFIHNLTVSVNAVPTLLCAGDKISFIAISGVVDVSTDVEQIFVLFIDSHKQVKQSYNLTEAENEIENTESSFMPVIQLTHNNQTDMFEPVAIGTQQIHVLETGGIPPFVFPSVGDKIVQIFVIHSNGKVESKLDTQPIFTVSPSIVCLQATSERDAIKQNRLQHITDADIVGLSYIGIGLAFIVVGSDILLRIYLEPYADKMKDEYLFNWKKWRWLPNKN